MIRLTPGPSVAPGPASRERIDDTTGHLRSGRHALGCGPGHRPGRAGPAGMAGTARAGPGRALQQDRKSTRLNSSHVAISYAVFCSKKKIKLCKVLILHTA